MTSEPGYMVQFDGVERGPFAERELIEMVEQKILKPDHLCSLNTEPRVWTPIRSRVPNAIDQDNITYAATPSQKWPQIVLACMFVALAAILLYNVFKIAGYQQALVAENKEFTLESLLNNPQLMVSLFIGAVLCCTMIFGWVFYFGYKLKKK